MKDEIKVIPKTMEKFFGCSGNMVKPSTQTVKNIVQTISQGEVITMDQLRSKLSKDFNVDATCPASTTNALKKISVEAKPICYWRVIKKKGELIAQFPNGVEGHASLLVKEGFEIDFSKKLPVVKNYEAKLRKII